MPLASNVVCGLIAAGSVVALENGAARLSVRASQLRQRDLLDTGAEAPTEYYDDGTGGDGGDEEYVPMDEPTEEYAAPPEDMPEEEPTEEYAAPPEEMPEEEMPEEEMAMAPEEEMPAEDMGGATTQPGQGPPADPVALAALMPSYTVAMDMEITGDDPAVTDIGPDAGGVLNVADATACAAACSAVPECTAASYLGANPTWTLSNNCYLKTIMPACAVPPTAIAQPGTALLIQDCDGAPAMGPMMEASIPSAGPMATTPTTAMAPTPAGTTTTAMPPSSTLAPTTPTPGAPATTSTTPTDGTGVAGSGAAATGVAAFTALVLGAVVAL